MKAKKPSRRIQRPIAVRGEFRKEPDIEQMSYVFWLMAKRNIKEKQDAGISTDITPERMAELDQQYPELARQVRKMEALMEKSA